MIGLIHKLFRRQSEDIPSAVRERYARIATAPRSEKRRIGPAVAKELGYNPAEIDRLSPSVTESFAGVGNPLSLGEVRPGDTVLDLGSGAGLDSLLAAGKVGPSGRVVGIDFTPEMVERARRNVEAVGLANVDFLQAPVESIPLAGDTADVALCNGLFNLCPDKPRALAEVYRVLAPGGRFLMADVLLEDRVTPEEVAHKGAWSD
jgi:SAM-dependent methyltransferase